MSNGHHLIEIEAHEENRNLVFGAKRYELGLEHPHTRKANKVWRVPGLGKTPAQSGIPTEWKPKELGQPSRGPGKGNSPPAWQAGKP
jgi:hypothetical protein